ncbi:transporter substrate-binding domain-containing protein [Roseobacter sp. YSTF-M11]|uniref:Transporter substrate-binding domain-containing protein n=1 Tax=Roseobacter insulae TaxID=2859783 RepID=A0A9X1JWY8_9RHOB|nr:transporter substrate-binding domain-containing protein [Roseobacter insulae]MBW4706665.1 transporter substrate-binding domain-containing protein [Roseobacter insulae]
MNSVSQLARHFWLPLLLLFLLAASPSRACEAPEGDHDLVVAIRSAEPFTYTGPDGMPRGFAVDLWHSVSTDIDRTTAFVVCDSIDEQEIGLRGGTIDVVISPLTITADRMRRYDFSQQYLSSGLTLAVAQTGAIDFEVAIETIVETVFQPTVARAIILFLLLNLVTAFLLRALMRSVPVELGDGKTAGPVRTWMAYSLEAVARTSGLKGVGDGFATLLGKIFEMVMAVVGTALSAMILGVITSAFVGAIGESPAVDAQALPGLRIATLRCSTAQEFLREQYVEASAKVDAGAEKKSLLDKRAAWLACDENDDHSQTMFTMEDDGLSGGIVLTRDWDRAVEQLYTGKVDAVLGDWIALSYLSRRSPYDGQVTVQGSVYRNEPYGWAISRANGSDFLRRAIDSALIVRMRDTEWRKRIENTLGSGAIAPN